MHKTLSSVLRSWALELRKTTLDSCCSRSFSVRWKFFPRGSTDITSPKHKRVLSHYVLQESFTISNTQWRYLRTGRLLVLRFRTTTLKDQGTRLRASSGTSSILFPGKCAITWMAQCLFIDQMIFDYVTLKRNLNM